MVYVSQVKDEHAEEWGVKVGIRYIHWDKIPAKNVKIQTNIYLIMMMIIIMIISRNDDALLAIEIRPLCPFSPFSSQREETKRHRAHM